MKLDCKNLGCPEPVIRVKNEIENLKDNDILEVELNSASSIENVTRFAKNQNLHVKEKKLENKTILYISKGLTVIETVCEQNENFLDTTLFLKDDKIGEGELGSMLIVGFMKSILEQEKLPKKVVCVNRAVLLTTEDENSEIVKIFKSLETKGVEIYSCGVCLNYFKKEKELKVGLVGNAYESIEMLLKGSVTL